MNWVLASQRILVLASVGTMDNYVWFGDLVAFDRCRSSLNNVMVYEMSSPAVEIDVGISVTPLLMRRLVLVVGAVFHLN